MPLSTELNQRLSASEGPLSSPAAPDRMGPSKGAWMTFMHTSSCPTST